jgi:hypothetical protein
MRLDDAIEAAAIAEHPDYPVHDLDDMKIQNHRENMRKAFRAGCAFLRSPEGLRLLAEGEIGRLDKTVRSFYGLTVGSQMYNEALRLARLLEGWQKVLENLESLK